MPKDLLDALDDVQTPDPEDDEILKDLFMEKPEETDDDDPLHDPKEVAALKKALDEKDKQINGLLQTVKSDRRKRQEMKGQLEQVTTTVNSILAQRKDAEEQLAAQASSEKNVNGIPVEFTEDGDAFLPTEKLNAIVEPYEQKIADLENMLQQTNQNQVADRESQQLIQSMVGENDAYPAAFSKYQAARKWANDRVIEFQQDNNVQGQFSSGQAMTYVFDDNMVNEFEQHFPGMSLADVVTAEDSPFHFRQMLKSTAKALEPETPEPDARFRQVMQKPSGLGKATNAKAGELSLSERVGALSATDIMNLSDDQIEALSKFMANDEQTDGIKF